MLKPTNCPPWSNCPSSLHHGAVGHRGHHRGRHRGAILGGEIAIGLTCLTYTLPKTYDANLHLSYWVSLDQTLCELWEFTLEVSLLYSFQGALFQFFFDALT